jgi:hypothetical protein
VFERLLGLRNDVGLLAEEYDPAAKRLVGNFPQAFSNVPLIDTARSLTSAEVPTQSRSTEGPVPQPAAEQGELGLDGLFGQTRAIRVLRGRADVGGAARPVSPRCRLRARSGRPRCDGAWPAAGPAGCGRCGDEGLNAATNR